MGLIVKIRSLIEYYTPDQTLMHSDDLIGNSGSDVPVSDESPEERRYEIQRQHQDEVQRHVRTTGPTSINDVKVGDTIEFNYDVDQEAIVKKIKFSPSGEKIFVVRAFDGGLVDNEKGTLLDIPASLAKLK